MDGLSDEALLAGLGSGNPDAAAAFVRRFQSRVYGLAVTMLHDRDLADDVAQETFVRAWRHAATYDARRGRVPSWLLTIARNLAIDRARLRPVTELPDDQRRAIVLATYAGRTAREISELDRVPLGTVKTRIRAAMLKLRD